MNKKTILQIVDEKLYSLAEEAETKEEVDKILDMLDKRKKLDSIKPEMVVQVAAQLLGIGMILNHERFSTITSKALSFIRKV